MAIAAGVVALICMVCAFFAGWVAPHNPFDLTTLELSDARLPPAWEHEGSRKYLLGTDDQGRDMLSAVMYGARISLVVGLASVALSSDHRAWINGSAEQPEPPNWASWRSLFTRK